MMTHDEYIHHIDICVRVYKKYVYIYICCYILVVYL